jgi:tRNA-2-methylthio-N6-dimethylallyladenosine synthase
MKTYHIITIGCQMNKSDSERIAGYLDSYGLKSVEKYQQADVVIINTCGVRQSAEDRVYGLAPKIKKENKKACLRRQAKLVITGCLANREDVKKRLAGVVDVWLAINDLAKLAEKLKLGRANKIKNYLEIPAKHESRISAFVPIGNGCNNFCAYCVVPYARGQEIYRPAEEILDEVKCLVDKGYKEITLIAQNVNSYVCHCEEERSDDAAISSLHKTSRSPRPKASGLAMTVNKQINFSQLLKMVNDIPGEFWIRFATSHPKDMSDELIKTIAECDKVCEHVHLPAQAGDNRILRAMNRNYTIEHYESLIKKNRQAMPNVAITTDIIVGFPGETKKEFGQTAKLFKKIKFDMAYIAQYSPRFGTAASKLKDDITKSEKKNREEELMKILRQTALENNKKYINQEVDVLIMGESKDGQYFGNTRNNKNVKINPLSMKYITHNKKQEDNVIGKFVKVKITKAQDFGLEGELVKEKKKKVIVIVGTTASGKTKLGVQLALQFNGEIISADSRQVYRGMDIGTGKDLKEYEVKLKGKKEKVKIKHHLIDVADPKENFDLAQWYQQAKLAIDDIIARGKMPIVVGGTGLYAQALVDGYELTDVKPNLKLRNSLEKKSKEELLMMLTNVNKVFTERLNNSEKNNKRRLIRYLEIFNQGVKKEITHKKNNDYEFFIIGVTLPKDKLRKNIKKRLLVRLEKEEMVEEVERLHKEGVNWERLESFGLEYKFIAQYLQDKLDYDEMVEKIEIASNQYTKRQMTWLRRWEKQGVNINWIKDSSSLSKIVNDFIKK